MKVNSFILGAPKCGTTALSAYLDEHPNVCFSRPKETWYFVRNCYQEWQQRSAVNDEVYHTKFFPHFEPSLHSVIADGSPMYLQSESTIRNIVAYNPDARFVVMVRNPLTMLPSWHSQILWDRCSETEKDLEKAWYLQEQRARGQSIPPQAKEPLELQYLSICSLGDQIETLLKHIDRSQLLIEVFDDFKKDPLATYRRVLEHLGLPDDGRSQFPVVNDRKQHKSVLLSRVLLSLGTWRQRFIGGTSLGIINRIIRRKPAPIRMSVEFKAELLEAFEPQIAKLENILARDLSDWRK